jgi:predicted MPP superfamily phosphohydrolase
MPQRAATSRVVDMAISIRRWLRAHVSHRLGRWSGRIVVALVGALLGLLLGANVTHDVGPFQARLSLSPTTEGAAVVQVPPLGTLTLHAYDGPIGIRINLTQLRQAEAQRLLSDPARLAGIGDRAADDVKAALVRLVIVSVVVAILGAAVLGLVVFRRRREAFVAAGVAVALLACVGGTAAATWDPEKLTEPTYTGLLANAPAVVGDARNIVSRFDVYREELAGLITNVSRLYTAVSTLPTFAPASSTIRVLHVSDLHLNPAAFKVIASVAKQFKVNFIVDTGDLVEWGSPPEARYAGQIAGLHLPYVFIRGNHDSASTAAAVAAQPNAIVLNGTKPVTVDGLTIIGTSDPRFTPDKVTRDDTASAEKVQSAGRQLAALAERMRAPPDVAMVHDPLSALPLKDKVPLVLAGHLHKRVAERLGRTLVLVEGSTGGAGLRGLQGEKPTPLECSVLYFDAATHKLQAHDDITLGGLGETEATIQRHLVGGEPQATH